ncbi:hypothetical protein WICPIJ_004537 [Wickerhamomyces pijperi]|uniref:C2H2-type domain-containing protein n=1 Tax=Wickerhamomyces pijperi TaxID=599730 RepID=A0A9P8Q5S0_WICPI|nr:hypothetical protein WICPIJ_004537 [Wickerhamomyces pijperi]
METLSSFFKCNSCQIQFPNSDSQRYHMKTDWHRYNLKRRVAQLTPIDQDLFNEKLNQSKKYEQEVDEFGFKVLKQPKESQAGYIAQKKLHIGAGSRGRHLQSGSNELRDDSPASIVSKVSHVSLGDSVYSEDVGLTTDTESYQDTASEIDTDYNATHDEDESEEEDDDDGVQGEQEDDDEIQPITSCLYCAQPHSDLESNVTHMFKSHGLYIPERTYLTDLAGLLTYLTEIIILDNECLCCGFQGSNLESIRAHVKDKAHCRMPFETKEERLEFAKFYDFSSIGGEGDKSKTAKKVGFQEEDDGEDSDSDSGSDNGINDNYTVATIDPLDSQLTLPSGTRLGHRSLNRIYRQNPRIPLTPGEGQLTVASQDRRLANGMTLQQYSKEEKHSQLIETNQKSRSVQRNIRRANHQQHFRDPMLQ